jgi:YD repeat-containing protein
MGTVLIRQIPSLEKMLSPVTATVELDDRSRSIGSQQPGLAGHDAELQRSRPPHERDRGRRVERDPRDRPRRRPGRRLRSILDPEGQGSSFAPDEVGRVTAATRPDGETTYLTYDDRGLLRSVTPPGRDAHVFSYDDYGHTTQYSAPDLEGEPTLETVMTFNHRLDHQLETATVGPWAITYDYEPTSGRLTTMTWPLDGATATTAVSYDSAGRPSSSRWCPL